MIRCKLVEYRSPDATQAVTRVGRAVTGETLPIGRAASSRIFLPDPRVRLEHAEIRRAEDGHLYLDTFGPVLVEQRATNRLRLTIGQRLSVGPYELMVEELDDGPSANPARLTLSFALRPQGEAADTVAIASNQGLRSGWLTRRWLSWALFIGIAVGFVALPLRDAVDAGPAQPVTPTTPPVEVGLDSLWNPGPLGSAHANFADDCRRCHGTAFTRVADPQCIACHERVGEHVADPKLRRTAFGAPRCATCHRDHQGAAGLRDVYAAGCADCHGTIASKAPDSRLPAITDFADEHPDFRLTIRRAKDEGAVGPEAFERVKRTPALRADSGLRFPHVKHLDPKGVKSPTGPASTGGRVVLACDDCHHADAGGTGFRPIEMARDCQSCHRLAIDLQAPDRQVTHGAVEPVRTAVRALYAELAIDRFPIEVVTVNHLLQRPTATATPRVAREAEAWVDEQSARALVALFEKDKGVCSTCHRIDVDRSAEPATYRVQPIVDTRRWLPASRFEHAAHAAAQCVTCHDAGRSKDAAEILIPGIEACRDCHAGARADRHRVVSRCDDCHRFHGPIEHLAFAGPAKRRQPQPTSQDAKP